MCNRLVCYAFQETCLYIFYRNFLETKFYPQRVILIIIFYRAQAFSSSSNHLQSQPCPLSSLSCLLFQREQGEVPWQWRAVKKVLTCRELGPQRDSGKGQKKQKCHSLSPGFWALSVSLNFPLDSGAPVFYGVQMMHLRLILLKIFGYLTSSQIQNSKYFEILSFFFLHLHLSLLQYCSMLKEIV